MTCFTRGVDSQETETLEVDSEGEKPRRRPEEQDVDLSDQFLTFILNAEEKELELFLRNKENQITHYLKHTE